MLAIIIPYYKLAFFKETLDSLAAQTNQDFKVYIGDDASPENPIGLLKQYKGKFDFVYHRFETNLGGISLVKQWDRCIALSNNEEWIMILGDDDQLSHNCLIEFYNNLDQIRNTNVKLIRFATQVIKGLDLVLENIYTHPIIENVNDFFWRKLTGKTRSSMSEYVFKREMYNNYFFNDFPLGWHSDDMAVFEFSNFSNIYSLNSAIVYIRVSEISISGNFENSKIKYDTSIYFYKSLLSKYSNKLSTNIKGKIIQKIEEPFYTKWQLKSYLNLIFLHLHYIGIYSMLKFNRRILINKNK